MARRASTISSVLGLATMSFSYRHSCKEITHFTAGFRMFRHNVYYWINCCGLNSVFDYSVFDSLHELIRPVIVYETRQRLRILYRTLRRYISAILLLLLLQPGTLI